MKLAAITILLAATAATAHAQPRDHARSHKSVTIARSASVGVTVLGAAIIAAAPLWFDANPSQRGANEATIIGVAGGAVMFAGPSAGNWYAHDWLTRGLALRVGGAAAVVGGALLGGSTCGQDGCEAAPTYAGIAIAGVGVASMIAGAVLDFVDAGPAVRRWNRRHSVDVMVAPTVVTSNGQAAPALAVVGRF